MFSTATQSSYFFACNDWLKKGADGEAGLRKELMAGARPYSVQSTYTCMHARNTCQELKEGGGGVAVMQRASNMIAAGASTEGSNTTCPRASSVWGLRVGVGAAGGVTQCPYSIEVLTSNVRGAGTDADVTVRPQRAPVKNLMYLRCRHV